MMRDSQKTASPELSSDDLDATELVREVDLFSCIRTWRNRKLANTNLSTNTLVNMNAYKYHN